MGSRIGCRLRTTGRSSGPATRRSRSPVSRSRRTCEVVVYVHTHTHTHTHEVGVPVRMRKKQMCITCEVVVYVFQHGVFHEVWMPRRIMGATGSVPTPWTRATISPRGGSLLVQRGHHVWVSGRATWFAPPEKRAPVVSTHSSIRQPLHNCGRLGPTSGVHFVT